MKITIITPTIGSNYLKKLLESINYQHKLNELFFINHFIVIDNSPINQIKTNTILNSVNEKEGIKRHIFHIPFSSGEDNYKGHKIYSAIPQFVEDEYVIFLDDDNYLEEKHIYNFVKINNKKKYDWTYSLRNIVDSENNFICNDYCESLGFLHNVFYQKNVHLIDTNCYFIKTSILKKIAHIWNRKAQYNNNDPDRIFGNLLMNEYPNYVCTQENTLCYRVRDDNSGVNKNLFLQGNKIMLEKYGIENICTYQPLYIAHFDEKNTEHIIQRIYEIVKKKDTLTNVLNISFKQWQLNLLDCIGTKVLCINAYTAKYIPSNSICLVHMCHKENLPKNILSRNDIYKILYTIESPNIRHQEQWDLQFFEKNFDIIITYWESIFEKRNFNTIYHPFVYRLTNYEYDMKYINDDTSNKMKSACILLENRDFSNTYKINDVELHACDYMRKIVVKNISNIMKVYCYGKSWENWVLNENNKNIIYQETESRFLDKDKTIDYYNIHYFSIILENCDAIGYVSEKIFDAWMVSSIPIYYGNFNERLKKFIGEDIPIDEMMIDVKKIGIENIGKYLDEIYLDEIEKIQENIKKYKKRVFEKVGIQKYNEKIIEVIDFVKQNI